MISEALKKEIVSRLQNAYSYCRIYLFGSYAYGTPEPGSDLDIAVILSNVESKVSESIRIAQLLSDIDVPKDIVVCSKDDFDFYRGEAGSIFRTIAEKGVLLNG
jgi:predicted nucleotidyltransferase